MVSTRMRVTSSLGCKFLSFPSLLVHPLHSSNLGSDLWRYSGLNFGLLVVVSPLMYIVVRTIPEIMPMEVEEAKDKERAEALRAEAEDVK